MTATVGGFGCIVLLLVTRRFGLAFPVHQFPNQPGIVETATSRSYSTTALNQKTNNDSDNDSDNEQGTIVERCFDAFNQRDLNSIMDCFADDCRYEDTLFQGSAVGKQDLKRRFQHALETTNLLLPSSKVIVDNVAWDPSTGKLGARWHIEMDDHGRRTRLPFSQGCSFYTTNLETGRIQSGFRVMESPFKPDDAIFNALIVPTKMMEALSPAPTLSSPSSSSSSSSSFGNQSKPNNQQFRSIIERAYDGWNRRDIDAAVACFTDDVFYEDTLYLKPMQGKEALRNHYRRVANQLPRICTIVLDDLVESPTNGNIGIRWHLAVDDDRNLLQGWSRGCSMYTTDPETGLITTGFDVTETPFKVNGQGLDLLLSPLQMLKF